MSCCCFRAVFTMQIERWAAKAGEFAMAFFPPVAKRRQRMGTHWARAERSKNVKQPRSGGCATSHRPRHICQRQANMGRAAKQSFRISATTGRNWNSFVETFHSSKLLRFHEERHATGGRLGGLPNDGSLRGWLAHGSDGYCQQFRWGGGPP